MAHSTDLRERIINAVIHKRYTLQKAADTFDVGAATVSRYLRRYRQTGDLTPRTSPGRPSALNEYQAWVEQSLISNDLTHDQRCDLLFDEIGNVRISRANDPARSWTAAWVSRYTSPLGSTTERKIKDELYASEQGSRGPICRVIKNHERVPTAWTAVRRADRHRENFGVYGVRKVWHALQQEGLAVGRDQVAA